MADDLTIALDQVGISPHGLLAVCVDEEAVLAALKLVARPGAPQALSAVRTLPLIYTALCESVRTLESVSRSSELVDEALAGAAERSAAARSGGPGADEHAAAEAALIGLAATLLGHRTTSADLNARLRRLAGSDAGESAAGPRGEGPEGLAGALLRALSRSMMLTTLPMHSALDFGPRPGRVLLPSFREWPSKGATYAMWVRLESFPRPAPVMPPGRSSVAGAGRGEDGARPGEAPLLRIRAADGLGIEVAVRQDGRVGLWLESERGMPSEHLPSRTSGGILPLRRWVWVCAVMAPRAWGALFGSDRCQLYVDQRQVLDTTTRYPSLGDRQVQEAVLGGFAGQMGAAVGVAKPLSADQVYALRAAMHSPGTLLGPPSETQSLPRPPVPAVPALLAVPDMAGPGHASDLEAAARRGAESARSAGLAEAKAAAALERVYEAEAELEAGGGGAKELTELRNQSERQAAAAEAVVSRAVAAARRHGSTPRLPSAAVDDPGSAGLSAGLLVSVLDPAGSAVVSTAATPVSLGQHWSGTGSRTGPALPIGTPGGTCRPGDGPSPMPWGAWTAMLFCLDPRRAVVAPAGSTAAAHARAGGPARRGPDAPALCLLDISPHQCHGTVLGTRRRRHASDAEARAAAGDPTLAFSPLGASIIRPVRPTDAIAALGGPTVLLPFLVARQAPPSRGASGSPGLGQYDSGGAGPGSVEHPALFRLLGAAGLPDAVGAMASACQASARNSSLFLRRGGLDALAHALRTLPPSDLSMRLWASVAQLVAAVAGCSSPELPGEGLAHALPRAPASLAASTDLSAEGPVVEAVPASPAVAGAVRGAPGTGERVLHPALFLVAPPSPAPFGWQVRRSAIARLLFDLPLWLSAPPAHAAAIAARMVRFAAANPLAVSAAVPVSAVCHAIRALLWERPEDGTDAPAMPHPMHTEDIDPTAWAGRPARHAAPVLALHDAAWRRVARVWLWQLARLIVQHACGRLPAGAVVAGVRRVTDAEARARRVAEARPTAHLLAAESPTTGSPSEPSSSRGARRAAAAGSRARAGSSAGSGASSAQAAAAHEVAGSLVLAPAASAAVHAVTCGPILATIKACKDPAVRLEAACTLLSLLPPPRAVRRRRSRAGSVLSSAVPPHVAAAEAAASAATMLASSGMALFERARAGVASAVSGVPAVPATPKPPPAIALRRRLAPAAGARTEGGTPASSPEGSVDGDAAEAEHDGGVPLPDGRPGLPPPPACRHGLGPWSSVLDAWGSAPELREHVAGAVGAVPRPSRADPGLVAAIRAAGDGAAVWVLLESADEPCVLAGLALLGRIVMHGESPGSASGALALHGGPAGLLGACLARLPAVSGRVYRAVLALVLGADPLAASDEWSAFDRRGLAPPAVPPSEITQPALIPHLFALVRRAPEPVRLLAASDLLVLVGGRPSDEALPCTGFGDNIARANRARLRRAKRWPEGLVALALAAEQDDQEQRAEPGLDGGAGISGPAMAAAAPSFGLEADATLEAAQEALVADDAGSITAAAALLAASGDPAQARAAERTLLVRIAASGSSHAVVQACLRAAADHFPRAQAAAVSEAASAVLALLCEGGTPDAQAVHAWISLLEPAADEDGGVPRARPVAVADGSLPVLGGASVAVGACLSEKDDDGGCLRAVRMHARPAAPLGTAGRRVLARVHCRLVGGYATALDTVATPRSSDMWEAAAREASAASDLVSGAAASGGVASAAVPLGEDDDPIWRLGDRVLRLWSLMSASLTGWSDLGLGGRDTKRELAAAEAARALMSRARVQAAAAAVAGGEEAVGLSRSQADSELSTSLKAVCVLAAPSDVIRRGLAATPSRSRGGAHKAPPVFEAWGTEGSAVLDEPDSPMASSLHEVTGSDEAAAAAADATACGLIRSCRSVAPGGAVAGVCVSGLSLVVAATAAATDPERPAGEVLRLTGLAAAFGDTVRGMTFTLRPRGDGPEPSGCDSPVPGAASAQEADVARAARTAAIALTSGSHMAPVLAVLLLRTADGVFRAATALHASSGPADAHGGASPGGSGPRRGPGILDAAARMVDVGASLVAAANRVWAAGAGAGRDDLVRELALPTAAASRGASGSDNHEGLGGQSTGPASEGDVWAASRATASARCSTQVREALASLMRQTDPAKAIGQWLEASAVHRARLAADIDAAAQTAAIDASAGAHEDAEALTAAAEAVVPYVAVFSAEEERSRAARAAQRRSRVWAEHSKRFSELMAELGRSQPWADLSRPPSLPWGMRAPHGSLALPWVPEDERSGGALAAASSMAVDMSAGEDALSASGGASSPAAGSPSAGDDGPEEKASSPCETDAEADAAASTPVPAAEEGDGADSPPGSASTHALEAEGASEHGRDAVSRPGDAAEPAEAASGAADVAAATSAQTDDTGAEAQAASAASAASAAAAISEAVQSDEEEDDAEVGGDWESVDITRATGDGPALYAAPCSLVLPHAVVEGRLEVSRTFLRFFPERLAGDDGESGAGDEDAPRPFGVGADPVAWVPDADADACHGCGAPIVTGLFFSGKHHCRRCGGVFCASCSRQRRPLPASGYFEPVRVCDACAAAEDAAKLTAAAAGASPPQRHRKRASAASREERSEGSVSDQRIAAVRRALATARLAELRIRSVPLADVTAVYGRRFLLRHLALEVFLAGGRPPLFLAFSRPGEHEKVAARIWKLRAALLGPAAVSSPLLYSPRDAPGASPPSVTAAHALALGYGPGSMGPRAGAATSGVAGSSGDPASLRAASGSAAGAGIGYLGTAAGAAASTADLTSRSSPPASVLSPGLLVRTMRWTEAWQRRLISNFDYLCLLNFAAGRTRSDPSQYPVMPWVIADYESEELDLQAPPPGTFRDLSKPVGALEPERLQRFRDRMEAFAGADESTPPFLYGSHYSNMGAVSFFLIRQEPFTSMHLSLQRGRFDHADRLFHSVAEAWSNVMQSQADVKELVPEFFCDPSFLRNDRALQLGTRQNGVSLGDVDLPPWAHGSPEVFVRTQREALESEHVSQHLHQWVDLIFGSKQRGEAAVRADNVFFHLTYEGAMDSLDVSDPAARASAEAQVAHFGQTPAQLFTSDHPTRMTQEQAAMAEWGTAIGSAMVSRRHSARRTVLRSPHRGPVTSVLLPATYPGCVTVDAWGVAATAALGPTAEAASTQQPFAIGYRGDGYLAVVAPEWTSARTLSVALDGAGSHADLGPAAHHGGASSSMLVASGAQSGGLGGFGGSAASGEDGGSLSALAASPAAAAAGGAGAGAPDDGTADGSPSGAGASGPGAAGAGAAAEAEAAVEMAEAWAELAGRGPPVCLLPSGGLLLRGCGPGSGAEIVRVPGRVDVVGGSSSGTAQAPASGPSLGPIASSVAGTAPLASWAIDGTRPTPHGQAQRTATAPVAKEAPRAAVGRRGSRGAPVAAAAAAQTLRPLPRASVVERTPPLAAAVTTVAASEDGTIAVVGHADGSLGLWLVSAAAGGSAGEGASGTGLGAGIRGLGLGFAALEAEREGAGEAAVASVIAGGDADVAVEASLLASVADASSIAGVAGASAEARPGANKPSAGATGAGGAASAGASGASAGAGSAQDSVALARPVASGGWGAAGWLLASDGLSSAVPPEAAVAALASAAGAAYGGAAMGATRGCPAVSADATVPVAALVATSLSGVGVCFGAGEGARGVRARLTADLDDMVAVRATAESRAGRRAGAPHKMAMPAMGVVAALLGLRGDRGAAASQRRARASSSFRSSQGGPPSPAASAPGGDAESEGRAWEVLDVEGRQPEWEEAARAQDSAAREEADEAADKAAIEHAKEAGLGAEEAGRREAAAVRARAGQRGRRARAVRRVGGTAVSGLVAAASGAGSVLGRRLVRFVAGGTLPDAAAGGAGEAAGALMGLAAGGQAATSALAAEAALHAEASETAIPLGFAGAASVAAALGASAAWLTPPASSAAAAFRGMSVAHGGRITLLGGSGGGGGSGQSGGADSPASGDSTRPYLPRACGRGEGGAGVGGMGSDAACAAVGGAGFRTVADVILPLLKQAPASGGDETRAALEAASSLMTPRPLPCLLGTPQTVVWPADPRDVVALAPLVEPWPMLRPLRGWARAAAIDAAMSPPDSEDEADGEGDGAEGGGAAAAASASAAGDAAAASPAAGLLARARREALAGESRRSVRRELSLSRAVGHFLPAGRPDVSEPWLPLVGHAAPITCAAVSSRFGRAVAGDADGVLTVHCLRAGRVAATIPVGARGAPCGRCPVQCVSFSPTGRILVGHGRRVTLLTLAGVEIGTARLEGAVVAATASASGRFIVAATRGRIVVIRSSTMEEAAVLEALPPAPVRSIAVLPSDRAVLAGFDRGMVGVYATDLSFYAAV